VVPCGAGPVEFFPAERCQREHLAARSGLIVLPPMIHEALVLEAPKQGIQGAALDPRGKPLPRRTSTRAYPCCDSALSSATTAWGSAARVISVEQSIEAIQDGNAT
jgi:hypothetical protein